jgi:hypothetical protein
MRKFLERNPNYYKEYAQKRKEQDDNIEFEENNINL